MDSESYRRSISLRPRTRTYRDLPHSKLLYLNDELLPSGRLSADYSLRVLWKKGFIRLLLVVGMIWMLLILSVLLVHIWSCQSSVAFFSALCNREVKVFVMLDSMGFAPKPPHCCTIPVASDPDAIVIPMERTPDTIVKNLTYIMDDEETDSQAQSPP